MIKDKKYSRLENYQNLQVIYFPKDNLRNCPCCELETLKGMPGGKDSICKNCGFKDPCCYD